MNRTLLLSLQIGVAVAMIAVWHVLTTTTLIGDPDKLQFFFSTPADVARQIWHGSPMARSGITCGSR